MDRSSLFTAVMNRIRGRLDESISESGAAIDFVDADVIRASDVSSGSPVLGAPALGNAAPLPELMVLQHMAVDRFNLRSGSPHPIASIKTIIDFLRSVRLSNGEHLSARQAAAMASFVRPLAARTRGRPRRLPQPSAAVSEEG